MKRTRRHVTRTGIAIGGFAGISGTALVSTNGYCDGKNGNDGDACNKFGGREDQPGQARGTAQGHQTDNQAHDRDGGEPGDMPGERVGHCKYD